MKIDAKDQQHQLWDYQQEITKRAERQAKSTKLFYLTLDGKIASKDSKKPKDNKNYKNVLKEYEFGDDEKENTHYYHCISFEEHILNWINECIKQSAEKSVLREALVQYKILIEKLTGQNTEMSKDIVEEILKRTVEYQNLTIKIA